MKSKRLTISLRKAIKDALIGDRFSSRRATEDHLAASLANDIYHDVLGDEAASIASSPRNWFDTATYLRVQFGGGYVSLDLIPEALDQATQRSMSSNWPIPFSKRRGTFAKYGARHAFSKRYNAIERAREEICSGEDNMRTHIHAGISPHSTMEKLILAWPEIEGVVREVCKTPAVVNLPAVPYKKISKMLGI